MSAKFFVDTNILVCAHDCCTGGKDDLANRLIQELWSSGKRVLSTQVLQELCVNLRHKTSRPFLDGETRELLHDYLIWQIVVNDGGSILEALTLERQFSISFWDAPIVQAAEKSGAETLYSEDLANGQKYGLVQIVNPFLSTAP